MQYDSTYPGAVDSIIDPSKLSDRRGNQVLNTLLIRYFHYNGNGSILCMLGIFLALISCLLRTFFVEVREDDSVNTRLCQ